MLSATSCPVITQQTTLCHPGQGERPQQLLFPTLPAPKQLRSTQHHRATANQTQCPASEVSTFGIWLQRSLSVPNFIKNLGILQSNTTALLLRRLTASRCSQKAKTEPLPSSSPVVTSDSHPWLSRSRGTNNFNPQKPTLPRATSWHRRPRPTQGTANMPDFLQTSQNNISTCPRLSRRTFRTQKAYF